MGRYAGAPPWGHRLYTVRAGGTIKKQRRAEAAEMQQVLHLHCSSRAASQPIRCAFAMAEKVIVVAGMLGKTVASTAWTLFQPGNRPSRSVWKPRGSVLMGK